MEIGKGGKGGETDSSPFSQPDLFTRRRQERGTEENEAVSLCYRVNETETFVFATLDDTFLCQKKILPPTHT